MTPRVRPVREDELPAYLDAMSAAFLDRPAVAAIAGDVKDLWNFQRAWAAFDGERICGTFRSWETELTVPGGGRLPTSAVTNVAVLPTHRPRGVLRAMIAAEHAAIRERGEAVGVLYAAEYPIYGRFGYGPGCQIATWTLDAHGAAFAAKPAGSVEVVTPIASARDPMNALFETWRLRQPGEIRCTPYRWDFDLGLREQHWGTPWKGFVAFHRDASGEVDGFARYTGEQKWERGLPRSVISVNDFVALTEDAYDGLWQFLGTMDLVATVKAEQRIPTERLPWLLVNARAATVSELVDGVWVRLFDVPRALAARTYERSADLVLEVVDAEAPGGRTRLQLDAGPDGSTCRKTRRSPDLTLDLAALSAAYLGGTRLRDAVLANRVDEHRAGALARADALFATLEPPRCSTFF